MKQPFDGKALGESIVTHVREFMLRQVAPLRAALADMDARIKAIPAGPKGDKGEPGEKGDAGEPGRIDTDWLVDLVRAEVKTRFDEIPMPKNGKDADMAAVKAMIDDAVMGAVSAIPPAKNGENGKDADPSVIADLVAKSVAEIVSSLPKPKDGENGKDADPELVRVEIERALDARLQLENAAQRVDEEFSARVSAALGRQVEIVSI